MNGMSMLYMKSQTLTLLRSMDRGTSRVWASAVSSGVFVVDVSETVMRYFSGRSVDSMFGLPV
eukprot:769898-Rhodomonas_salina.1